MAWPAYRYEDDPKIEHERRGMHALWFRVMDGWRRDFALQRTELRKPDGRRLLARVAAE